MGMFVNLPFTEMDALICVTSDIQVCRLASEQTAAHEFFLRHYATNLHFIL